MAVLVAQRDVRENVAFLKQLQDPADRFEFLRRTIKVSDSVYLRELEYGAYLLTLYWTIVRGYVLWRHGFACGRCGCEEDCQVHHLSYAHVGCEYRHLRDLEVLCKRCHSDAHVGAAELTEALKSIAEQKRMARAPEPVRWNPHYDPRACNLTKIDGRWL